LLVPNGFVTSVPFSTDPSVLNRRVKASFGAHAATTAATNIAIAALGVCSGILAARLLGPRGRGELAAIQSSPSLLAMLAMFGMPEAVVYYSARAPQKAGRYLGSAISIAVLSSFPFILVGYALMPLLLHAQTVDIMRAGRWYLAMVPIYALIGMLAHPLRGRGDFAIWNLLRLGPNVLWVGVLALAWACGKVFPAWVAEANLLALASLFLPYAAVAWVRIPGPFTPNLSDWPPMLRYGLPCMLTGVPQMLNLRLDQMLMAALLPPRELGLYSVAVAWSAAPAPLLSALGAVTTPAVASASNVADGSMRLAATVRTAVAVTLLLGFTLTLCTPIAIALLFGSRFVAAVPAAMVLVPAAALLGLNLVLQEGLRGMGRPYAVLQAEFGGFIITAIVLAATLRPLGIMGAAIASFLGYTTVCVILVFKTQRISNMSLSTLLRPNMSEVRLAFARLGTMARNAIAVAMQAGIFA
jgi:O-antigen/teichoic acid export membrane protein